MRQSFQRLILVLAACGPASAAPAPSPCEALGAADAVFIGEAGPKVSRMLEQQFGPPYEMAFSPLRVIRAFHGVTTPWVYVTPAGTMEYPIPGERYLIYGRRYAGDDMFITSAMYGTKHLATARTDVEFLEAATAQPLGATITGVLELDETASASATRTVSPLANIEVRLTKDHDVAAVTRTQVDGEFLVTGLSPGTYVAFAELPPDLAIAESPPVTLRIQNRGCGSLPLRAIPNGHIRGVLRTADGRPASFQTLSLLPAELSPGEPDRYFQSVETDSDGRYVFDQVRPGQYILGRLAYRLNGAALPSSYYPGVPSRETATPVVVGRSEDVAVSDFQLLPPPAR